MLPFLCGSIMCGNNKCLTEQHSHFGYLNDNTMQSSTSQECLSKFARLLRGLLQSELSTAAYSTAYPSQAMSDKTNELVFNGMSWYIFIDLSWSSQNDQHYVTLQYGRASMLYGPWQYSFPLYPDIIKILIHTHTTFECYAVRTKLYCSAYVCHVDVNDALGTSKCSDTPSHTFIPLRHCHD